MRLVRKGWRAPCRIVHDATGWFAIIDGEEFAAAADPLHAVHVDRIWHSGEIITEAEYHWLESVREWARLHRPRHPAANALLPIDFNLTPPIEP
jgi:hypothetical protein